MTELNLSQYETQTIHTNRSSTFGIRPNNCKYYESKITQ